RCPVGRRLARGPLAWWRLGWLGLGPGHGPGARLRYRSPLGRRLRPILWGLRLRRRVRHAAALGRQSLWEPGAEVGARLLLAAGADRKTKRPGGARSFFIASTSADQNASYC